MTRTGLFAAVALSLASHSAQAAPCGVVLDDLAKAISGHLTMSPDMKASMMRMAVHSYDSCMVGDAKSSDATRDLIMRQIKEGLGGR
jgi:hypothetical protein